LRSYPGRVDCQAAVPAPESSANTNKPLALDSADPAKADEAFGERVQVTGIYRLKKIHSKGGKLIAEWPVVVLGDDSEVMLGSFWKHKDGRSVDEEPDYIEKRVRAVGVLHSEPPKEPYAQNLMAPTIAPVESLMLEEPTSAKP
jgi:hypothetical protein